MSPWLIMRGVSDSLHWIMITDELNRLLDEKDPDQV